MTSDATSCTLRYGIDALFRGLCMAWSEWNVIVRDVIETIVPTSASTTTRCIATTVTTRLTLLAIALLWRTIIHFRLKLDVDAPPAVILLVDPCVRPVLHPVYFGTAPEVRVLLPVAPLVVFPEGAGEVVVILFAASIIAAIPISHGVSPSIFEPRTAFGGSMSVKT